MTGAGDLRWRVRIEKRAPGDATFGLTEGEWVEHCTRQAEIITLTGGEAVQQQRLNSTQPYIIKVRYDARTREISQDMRAVEIVNGSPVRFFAIKTANDKERERAFITLMCVEGDADGQKVTDEDPPD